MPDQYGTITQGLVDRNPQQFADVSNVGGRVRIYRESIPLTSQAQGTTIGIAHLPKDARFLYGLLAPSASLGSATVAIGTADEPELLRAADTATSDTEPVLFGAPEGVGHKFDAATEIIATTGAANLPSSGTLQVLIFYVVD